MTRLASAAGGSWIEAVHAAALLAVDPAAAGGVALRALPGPVRDRWLEMLRAFLPADAPLRRLPANVPDGRLLGGLDLAATLRAGRPVVERGLLAEADGGLVLLVSAERLSHGLAGRLAAVLDSGEVALERDGFALRSPARIAVVALDEAIEEDERPPEALLDRLAFAVDLNGIALRDAVPPLIEEADVAAARVLLADVGASEAILAALCAAALALGVRSIRSSILALRVARAAAALAGRTRMSSADAAIAARLVLAPRATLLPAAPPHEADAPDAPPPEPPADRSGDEPEADAAQDGERALGEIVLSAARAAIPPGLLARLQPAGRPGTARHTPGRVGPLLRSTARGRPVGVRRGDPGNGARLNVVETLRAAAPWQPLRRQEAAAPGRQRHLVEIRREDFRISRREHRARTTTIFVVDASGSAALHRLAEAKGAVELLLAECYARRDQVALLAFRGLGAELLLPPTRSLVRAKRSLAGLPGGGGTPLAGGIDAAAALADQVRRRGETPTVVLLTDGRANIGRDGLGGRARAEADALAAARQLRAAGTSTLLVDTSPRPQPAARRLAEAMDAGYLPLPYADAAAVARAARAAAGPPERAARAA